MAIVTINYDCGCGFHGKTVEEAIKHVDERKHVLNIAGVVKPSERKARKASPLVTAKPRPRAVRPVLAATPVEGQADVKNDFGNLRARLQRKHGGTTTE